MIIIVTPKMADYFMKDEKWRFFCNFWPKVFKNSVYKNPRFMRYSIAACYNFASWGI